MTSASDELTENRASLAPRIKFSDTVVACMCQTLVFITAPENIKEGRGKERKGEEEKEGERKEEDGKEGERKGEKGKEG